jgi:hypothetical protein
MQGRKEHGTTLITSRRRLPSRYWRPGEGKGVTLASAKGQKYSASRATASIFHCSIILLVQEHHVASQERQLRYDLPHTLGMQLPEEGIFGHSKHSGLAQASLNGIGWIGQAAKHCRQRDTSGIEMMAKRGLSITSDEK